MHIKDKEKYGCPKFNLYIFMQQMGKQKLLDQMATDIPYT
jgi:hypothetical protein